MNNRTKCPLDKLTMVIRIFNSLPSDVNPINLAYHSIKSKNRWVKNALLVPSFELLYHQREIDISNYISDYK